MTNLELTIIAAVSRNNVIGRNGSVPWKILEDLKRFRQLTLNRPIILGRKTFESIGKPLDKRVNYVVSRQENYHNEGIVICKSIEEAIARIRNKDPYQDGINYDIAFIIGGQTIYEQTIHLAHRLEITKVNSVVEGDAYFPIIDYSQWVKNSVVNRGDYSFITYLRNKLS